MIAISPIPALSDNYIWLISDNKNALVVDPGDATPVIQVLEQQRLKLAGILLTHHHADHTAGVQQLKNRYNCPVWGPKNEFINHRDHLCDEGDTFELKQPELSFKAISVPGHTLGHIAYLLDFGSGANALFCGDSLFSGGCGRIFEGTPVQMWHSLQKLMTLPQNTLIYPAHEYTLANLKFALLLEPDNTKLREYQQKISQLCARGLPSLPTNLKQELAINPFLRVEQETIIQAAKKQMDVKNVSPAGVFAAIRHWKDSF